MKYKFLLLFAALLVSPLMAAPSFQEWKEAEAAKAAGVIASLKTYPASKILPGLTTVLHRELPNIPLEKWLKSVVGDTPLEWGGGECASHDSEIEGDGCSSFRVSVSTPEGHCPSIYLGFVIPHDGASVYLMYDGSGVNDFGVRGGLEQLSDLEKTLKSVKAKAAPNRPSSLDIISRRRARDILSHVRGLDVHHLDPSLPSERFDMWIKRILGWTPHWSVSKVWRFCEFNNLEVYVSSGNTKEEKGLPEAFTITTKLGTWEEEIKGEPKLDITFFGPPGGPFTLNRVESLSAFKNKIEAWKVSPYSTMPPPKPVKPVYKPTLPVVQNMTYLGGFSRTWSTPTWHCYGYNLELWKYGERVFGTFYDVGGQCADSREPTHVVRDGKLDPKTGELEFWTYGKPGKKFVGKMEKDMVTGKFVGGYGQEPLKLKRNESTAPLLDWDKNVEAWCKDHVLNLRNIVENEVEELCKSLGVQ